MPLLSASSYRPPVFLKNGHLQTVYPTLFRPEPSVDYQRERLELPDGDFVDLDWSRVGGEQLVLALHGLEGNSEAKYMQGILRAFNRRGWDGAALNFRGCSGEPNRLPRAYHSGETGDLRSVLKHLLELDRYHEIAIVGFSLGGNVLLKFLGEAPGQVPKEVKTAVAVSVPIDLAGSSEVLARRENWIYMRRFMKRLKRKFRAKAHLLPQDVELEGMTTFLEFDGAVTAPLHGFASAEDYWQQSSSKQFLPQIQTRSLLLTALNDPFLSASCYPYEIAGESKPFWLEVAQNGGHVGFIRFNGDGEYWHEKRIADFVMEK